MWQELRRLSGAGVSRQWHTRTGALPSLAMHGGLVQVLLGAFLLLCPPPPPKKKALAERKERAACDTGGWQHHRTVGGG